MTLFFNFFVELPLCYVVCFHSQNRNNSYEYFDSTLRDKRRVEFEAGRRREEGTGMHGQGEAKTADPSTAPLHPVRIRMQMRDYR